MNDFRLKDYPSNFLLSIETSISLIEFDLIGYPLAILFNLIHLLTRFSIFTAKIPNWKDLTRIGNRMGDADARLEYLRKKSLGDNNGWKAVSIVCSNVKSKLTLSRTAGDDTINNTGSYFYY